VILVIPQLLTAVETASLWCMLVQVILQAAVGAKPTPADRTTIWTIAGRHLALPSRAHLSGRGLLALVYFILEIVAGFLPAPAI